MLFRKLVNILINKLRNTNKAMTRVSKEPQLHENDLVLVKIVAHKGRHKLQDRWEPEEYVVIEQPIAGTPMYKVKPVNGNNVRTLHRNLLLPLGVKLEPDYESDDSILEEDSNKDEG